MLYNFSGIADIEKVKGVHFPSKDQSRKRGQLRQPFCQISSMVEFPAKHLSQSCISSLFVLYCSYTNGWREEVHWKVKPKYFDVGGFDPFCSFRIPCIWSPQSSSEKLLGGRMVLKRFSFLFLFLQFFPQKGVFRFLKKALKRIQRGNHMHVQLFFRQARIYGMWMEFQNSSAYVSISWNWVGKFH